MTQLHKKFADSQVKELMERYLRKEIERKYIQKILDIKRSRFFVLLKKYKEEDSMSSFQDYLENYNMVVAQKNLLLMTSN